VVSCRKAIAKKKRGERVLPLWFRPVAVLSLLAGWVAVIVTLVMMIRTKRAQRLAAEARATEAAKQG